MVISRPDYISRPYLQQKKKREFYTMKYYSAIELIKLEKKHLYTKWRKDRHKNIKDHVVYLPKKKKLSRITDTGVRKENAAYVTVLKPWKHRELEVIAKQSCKHTKTRQNLLFRQSQTIFLVLLWIMKSLNLQASPTTACIGKWLTTISLLYV